MTSIITGPFGTGLFWSVQLSFSCKKKEEAINSQLAIQANIIRHPSLAFGADDNQAFKQSNLA